MSLPVDAPGPTRDHNTKHTLVLYISAFTTITRRWNTFMERRRTKQFEGFHGMILDQRVLDDRYTSIRDIGDGSFGNVAIKTMKKPIDPPEDCLKLREVQSLHLIPRHAHIVPVLESFYDPTTRLFHMVMENMEQNLYQLIKSRQNHVLDLRIVKSILLQILKALEHCHQHNYFHRDIKPENVLVTCSNPAAACNSQVPSKDMQCSANTAHYITPPSTPVQYLVKLADFGLAREIDSKPPYTTYVSTRWYRAPEVLLRSGHYSAPVDMWAFGAMAVELATLKPLFPGSNEVDQVWRICEVMGSPGDWRDRAQNPVGGGPWEEGVRLAAELGFSFPKTPPRAMETILGKDWPLSMAKLLTELLYWNPAPRPTSIAALQHEFFQSAQSCPDPAGTPRVERSSIVPWMDLKAGSMGRHLSLHRGRDNIVQENEHLNARTSTSSHTDAKFPSAPRPIQRERIGKDEAVAGVQRQSWFSKKRDSLIGRSNAPVPIDMLKSEALSAVHQRRYTSKLVGSETTTGGPKAPFPGSNHAPMPLLPPMLPISPIRDMTPVMAADRAPSRIANNSSAQYIHQQRAVHGRKIWHDDQAQSKAEPKGAIDLSRLSSVESNRHMSTENSTAVEQAPIPHEYSVVQPPRRGNNESASGFGNFLAHLRKKHKHAGPLDSSATRNTQDSSPLSAKSRTQVANEPRHLLESRSEKTTQQHVQSFMDHDHRGSGDDGKGTRLETSITTQRSGSTTRTRPIRISRQGPTYTDESYLISSRTKEGPVSSRTRLSAPQATRTSDHVPCCQNDDTEYLDQELVSTALAMQKLDAFPAISPSSSNPKKGVPSYAKSTAASARRSSAINSNVTSSARRGMTRKTTSQKGFYQTHPPLPMNSLQRALF